MENSNLTAVAVMLWGQQHDPYKMRQQEYRGPTTTHARARGRLHFLFLYFPLLSF